MWVHRIFADPAAHSGKKASFHREHGVCRLPLPLPEPLYSCHGEPWFETPLQNGLAIPRR